MHIDRDRKLDFRDVLIRPKRSALPSRATVDIQRAFCFKHSGARYHGVPVIAANRCGTEVGSRFTLDFYGSSFIASPTGEMVAVADRSSECVLDATFDLDEVANLRRGWGVFRDRRVDLY